MICRGVYFHPFLILNHVSICLIFYCQLEQIPRVIVAQDHVVHLILLVSLISLNSLQHANHVVKNKQTKQW